MNGHAISDIELMPSSLCDYSYRKLKNISIDDLHLVSTNSRIFTAIFPNISILNHSCDPNIRNCFEGANLSIYAARDIAKNEEIFNCYGPNYKIMSKSERQTALKQQYCFECNCIKCSTNDQTFDKSNEYNCPEERCRAPISLDLPQWWHNLHDDDYVLHIMSKFKCKKCKKSLLLNPHTLREFFGTTQTESCDEFRRDKMLTERAIVYYMNVSKCLTKHHELKAAMAQSLLRFKMQGKLRLISMRLLLILLKSIYKHLVVILADHQTLFIRLAHIAIENYAMVHERFGLYSLEIIIAITYLLNILKMAKQLEKDPSSTVSTQEINRIYETIDIEKIKKSITILSNPLYNIFKGAIETIAVRSD